jgi:hypothetical protein
VVLVNFKTVREEKKAPSRVFRRNAVLAVGLFAVALTGAFFPKAAPDLTESRALFTDENETVVSAFSAIPGKVPELSGWVENVKELYVEGAFPAYLVDGRVSANGARLLRFENDNIYFSRQFFDADPVAQESALLDMVLAFHRGEPTPPAKRAAVPELARRSK